MKGFSIVATALALALAVPASVQAEEKLWSYKTNDESVYGPAEWKVKYPMCGGQRQSPINIEPKENCRSEPHNHSPLVLSGECTKFNVKEYDDAFKAEAVDSTHVPSEREGKPYKFLQTHFHAPSEHTIRGKAHDGEMHYVHKGDDGLLVIGLFFEKKVGVTTDAFVLQLWKQLTGVTIGSPVSTTLASYFPILEGSMKKGRMFNYPGSLTTPMCNETVDWWVLEKPLLVATADFESMQKEMKRLEAADNGKNARPAQPLNGRVVTTY